MNRHDLRRTGRPDASPAWRFDFFKYRAGGRLTTNEPDRRGFVADGGIPP